MTDKNIPTIELHPLCTYFPRMSDAEFISLKENIQANGQLHPIYTLDGMILDGGNRYRALCELGIEPVIREYSGSNPTQFILSANLHRRHLTQGQSAAVVSASQSWAKAQAADSPQVQGVALLDSATARAKQSGVGHRTQQLADKLVKEAPAELVKEVIDGKKSLNKAIKEISPPKPVAAKPEPVVAQEAEDGNDQLSSIADGRKTAVSGVEAGNDALESGDGVLASIDEVRRLTELNRDLSERISGLIKDKEEAVKNADYWKDRFLTLEAEFNESLAK